MNKAELIDKVALEANLTKADAVRAVNAVMSGITEGLSQGNKVILPGFGTFEVRERAARDGRNPQNGNVIRIPASKNPAFKAGKDLKKAVQDVK
jgi:DNA-binding protein HU-beta